VRYLNGKERVTRKEVGGMEGRKERWELAHHE
jgi:hypothetical protein